MPIKIKREVPEMERNNRVAMLAHLIEVLVISLLVFMQTAVGITSFAYAIIIFAIGMAPVIAEFIFWNKNHETNAIKHLVAIGYAVFYTCNIFTTTSITMYAFALPMVFIVSLYNESKQLSTARHLCIFNINRPSIPIFSVIFVGKLATSCN